MTHTDTPPKMPIVTYEVVEHDGGWTYKVGDTFAETFATRDAAETAARRAAAEHELPPEPTDVEYADETGAWRTEHVGPDEAPHAIVDPDPTERVTEADSQGST